YIMNSRDMCMIDHLDDIMDAGIDCIKIEGRAKSAYYAAIVTGAYRHVLDDVAAGREVDPVWRDEVEHVSHRHYSTGFYYGQPGQYYDNSRYIRDWQVCAVVTDCDADGNATLSLRNKFAAGDEIEIDIPRRSIRLMVGDDEIAARMAAQQHFRPAARDRRIPASLRAYAKLVSSADKGAVRIVEEE
ncbi:MAG: hypothetical protein EGR20_22810, partial [Alistipes onderdonkii]|nr:hypothetical protein [Alistipes onderdonkii]